MDKIESFEPVFSDFLSENRFLVMNWSVVDLVSFLKSSYRSSDFELVGQWLKSKEETREKTEEALRIETEKNDRIGGRISELEATIKSVEREAEGYRKKRCELEERCRNAENDLRVLADTQRRCKEIETELAETETALGDCRNRCCQLEEQCKASEEDCRVLRDKESSVREEIVVLVDEMKKKERELGDYRRKVEMCEPRIAMLEEDYRAVCGREREVRKRMEDLEDEVNKAKVVRDDMYLELKMQFEELECSKKFVEDEREGYKSKCGDLEVEIVRMDERYKILVEKEREGWEKIVGLKELLDENVDGNSGQKSTSNIIVISDSEEESVLDDGKEKSAKKHLGTGSKILVMEDVNGEEMLSKKRSRMEDLDLRSEGVVEKTVSSGDEGFLPISTARKRRLARVVSDSEDGEDEVLSTAKNTRDPSVNVSPPIDHTPANLAIEDENRNEKDGKGESLEGSDLDGTNESVTSSSSSTWEDEASSGDSLCHGFAEILGKIQRRRKGLNWEYEADMLCSFEKDSELCMKAVCALYRRQTDDEKSGKDTFYINNRGFSKIDAVRASGLAEFLTDDDPHGPLKKTVKELEMHDPKAIDYCRKIASRYSKQLFEIYQKKEDPHFRPS